MAARSDQRRNSVMCRILDMPHTGVTCTRRCGLGLIYMAASCQANTRVIGWPFEVFVECGPNNKRRASLMKRSECGQITMSCTSLLL
jgi:hypothetical protein